MSTEKEVTQVQIQKPKHPGGRPSIYTKELGERICREIENSSKGIKTICESSEDFPSSETIRAWLCDNTYPEFSARYARAKESQTDYLADEMLEVAKTCLPIKFHVDKARLEVDTMKWIASKLKSKKYGDKITQEHVGKDGEAIKIESQKADLSKLTEDELKTWKFLQEKIELKKDKDVNSDNSGN